MKMRWYKMRALMHRDFLIVKRSKWRLVEVFYFPITTVIIWGLFSLFSREFALEAGLVVLAVNIFWSFSSRSQQHVNLQMNEDVWSGSLKQVLSSGISEFEYLVSRIITSITISFTVMFILLVLAFYAFNLTIVATHMNIIAFLVVSAFIASIGLSVITAALIIFFGREYAFLAWTVLEIFILFSAPFFPIEIFPKAIQGVSWFMPYTRIFLSIRNLVSTGTVSFELLSGALIVSIIYLIVSFPLYYKSFQRARRTGQFIKMK